MVYDHKAIEDKWRQRWRQTGVYKVDLRNPTLPKASRGKFYNLMMFPYPSAEGLHVGNMYAFTGADIYGRFKAMQGYEVFEPIGLDGFGIHSENYAIKIGKHPAEQAKVSEKRFYEQLSWIGNRFSWENRLETYDPKYYKWTQWLFGQMFKRGLAYRKKSLVNWCPSCKTVLADEQVEGGVCERCKTETGKKETYQWFFKITAYAQRLLDNIEKIDWPEKIKTAQRSWIGRKEGVEVDWQVEGLEEKITTFTTRLDTIYGVTFLVLAPEHELVAKLLDDQKIKDYVAKALKKTEQKRKVEEKEKTGVNTGLKAVHPLTGEKLPVWVADFVLMDYGSGAVMGVPAHDERDRAFAKKFKLPVIDKLVDKEKVLQQLKPKQAARKIVNYHLRDWCVSRQRYWGPPIPMVHCENCSWQPVAEKDLPVELPYVKDFKPGGDGRSPLAKASKDWLEVNCPKCGGKARRETDVSDTFLDSAWYFLRYPSIGLENSKIPWNREVTRRWLPVDAYIGGAEHAVLHLMYSRFVWMALQDWGYLAKELGDEPFPFLYGHGLIIKDGAKMSKSRGNVVIPDKYIDKYGVDALRMYLMFLGPYDQGGDFRDAGMVGMRRFLERIWQLFEKCQKETTPRLKRKLQQTIKKVGEDVGKFKYNTAIAALMELVNVWKKEGEGMSQEDAAKFLKLLALFAPYLSEELWFRLGNKFSVHQQRWPDYDAELARGELVTVVVQINGKLRARLELERALATDKKTVLALVKKNERVQRYIEGKKISKEIFVPEKLVNLVVK